MTLENKLKRANIDFSWIYLDKGSAASPRLPSFSLPANPPLPLPRPSPLPCTDAPTLPTPLLTPQGRTPYRGRGWAPSMKKIKIIPSSTFCQKFKFYVLDRFSPFRLAAAMELVILYKAPKQSSSSSLFVVKKKLKKMFLFHFVFRDLSFRCSLLIEPCSQPPSYTPSLLFHHFLLFLFLSLWHFKYTMSFVCRLRTSFPAQKVDLGNKGGQFPQSRHLAQKAEKMDYGLDSS